MVNHLYCRAKLTDARVANATLREALEHLRSILDSQIRARLKAQHRRADDEAVREERVVLLAKQKP
jgi:hypothetical protein